MINKDICISKLKPVGEYLKTNFGVIGLTLFGSVARGQQTAASDVDLLVETNTPNPFLLLDLKEFIAHLLGCEVDIVHKHKYINPYLLSNIQEDGITIL